MGAGSNRSKNIEKGVQIDKNSRIYIQNASQFCQMIIVADFGETLY